MRIFSLNFLKNKRKIIVLATLISAVIAVSILLIPQKTSAATDLCASGKLTQGASCTDLSGRQGTCQVAGKLPSGKEYLYCKGELTTTEKAALKISDSGGLGWIGNIAFNVVTKFLGGLVYIAFIIFGVILQLAAWFVDAVFNSSSFSTFTKASIVIMGWGITRDVANMFFSLIIIIIAFATILRIESYGVKQVLPRLLIAALLINFSLVIAGVIIDFSQVLTGFFLNGAKQGGTSVAWKVMQGLNVQMQAKPPSLVGNTTSAWLTEAYTGVINAYLLTLPTMLFGIVVMLVAAFVLFAAGILFMIRVVAIWFLLILVPLAWLFYILPATKTYWSMWWSNFLKWVFFAPAYAFFYYLAILMIGKGTLAQDAGVGAGGQPNISNASKIFDLKFFIDYICIIGLLLGGLIVAQKMGIWGSGALMKLGQNAAKGVGRSVDRWMAKGAERGGEGRWNTMRRGLSYLSPTAWKKGWEAHTAQKEREAYPVSSGARQDLINKYLDWNTLFKVKLLKGGGQITDYRERAVIARRQDERKDIKTSNAERMVRGYEDAREHNDVNKMTAYLQALTEQNDQNELLRYYAANWKRLGLDKQFNNRQEAGYDMTAEGLTNFVEEQLKPRMGEQDAYRLSHDINRIMESNGQWIGRINYVDPESGKYKIVPAEKFGLTREDAKKLGVDLTGMSDDKVKELLRDIAKKLDGKSWLDRNNKEKEVTADIARRNAHIEWSKQDPQVAIRSTGRFSYINEGYGMNGETIDLGPLTEEGKEKIMQLEPSQANRMHTHSKAALVFRHADEVKEYNKPLYDNLMKDLLAKTEGKEGDELKKYIEQTTAHIAKLSESEMKNAMEMIQKARTGKPKEPENPPEKPKESEPKIISKNIEEEYRKATGGK